MKLLFVCGDREWKNPARILEEVERRKPTLVLQGGCRGADLQAHAAAQHLGIHSLKVDAIWDYYGPSAGPIRNAAMTAIVQAFMRAGWDIEALAFHSNIEESTGTKNMIGRLKDIGMPVEVIRE